MYQSVKYYDYEKRERSNCSCLLFFLALISVASLAAVAIASSEVLYSPVISLLEDAEISLAFNDFIRDYDRSYTTDADLQYRKVIFTKNYKLIKELNKQHTTATFQVNQFADLTDEEFEEQYLDSKGLDKKCNTAQAELRKNKPEPIKPNTDIEIDWVRKGKVSSVKNQGRCGSCWSFSTTSLLETMYAIRENKMVQFSEQQIVDCCRSSVSAECEVSDGCKGGLVLEGLQYAINKGMMLEKDYPYKAHERACKYDPSKIIYKPESIVEIKGGDVKEMEKIILGRTIAVSISASHPTFKFYKGGILEKSPEAPLNHGVVIVGAGSFQGTPYWLVRNSWDSTWGDMGYIRISRSLDNYPTGVCGIASCAKYVE